MYSVIVIGITSSLGGALIRRLPRYTPIYGCIRSISKDSKLNCLKQEYRDSLHGDENVNLTLLDYDGSSSGMIKCLKTLIDQHQNKEFKVLYLSTQVNLDVLYFLRESKMPTLLIGSGAVTDWENERKGFKITELAQNKNTLKFGEYIEDKIKAERIATLTIHPGFNLPDERCPFTYSGLHIDSCEQIFAPKFNDQFNWGKSKFVTPIADITRLLDRWVHGDVSLHVTGGYSLGTNFAYQRWELRAFAGFNDIPDSVRQKYPHDSTTNYSKNMDANQVSWN